MIYLKIYFLFLLIIAIYNSYIEIKNNVIQPINNKLSYISGYFIFKTLVMFLLMPFDFNNKYKPGTKWIDTEQKIIIEIISQVGYVVNYKVLKSHSPHTQQYTHYFYINSISETKLVRYTTLTGTIHGIKL